MNNNRFSGFTLIELIIVVTTLSIIAAIVIPSFLVPHKKVKSHAIVTETQSVLKLATEYSKAYNHEIILRFVKEESVIKKLELIDTNPGGSEILLKEIIIEDDILVTLNHQVQQISYTPQQPIDMQSESGISLMDVDTSLKFYLDDSQFFELKIYPL